MEIFHQLGTALGLATLSGINLYLTVLVTGLAIRLHWITLASQYAQFEILAHPVILGITGILFILQFWADKIPWLDSLWDALQTFIRPLGGACLAVLAMGHSHPTFNIAVALLGGCVALTSHTAKSGTRLAVNTSPEPFSNVFLSLTEDAGIIGALILVYLKPTIALGVGLLLLLILFILMPRILARARMILWLIKNKLNAPAWKEEEEEKILPSWIPPAAHQQMKYLCTEPFEIAWALPCATGASSALPPHMRGWLVALASSSSPLYFFGKKRGRWMSLLIPIENLLIRRDSRLLSDRLVLSTPDSKNGRHTFVFPHPLSHEVCLVKEDIHRRTQFSSFPHTENFV